MKLPVAGIDIRRQVRGASLAVVVIAACVGLGHLVLVVLPHANVSLVFLTGVLVVAARSGLSAALIASLLGFLAFNFFFISPQFTLNVNDDGDVAMLIFFLVIAAITGNLAARMHMEVERNRNMVEQLTRTLRDLEVANEKTEREQLRSALLASVSHDLRTPLASIIGSASSLLELGGEIKSADRIELLETVREEAERLNRYIQNLLDMTRLGSGPLTPQCDWADVDDIISSAVDRLHLERHTQSIDIQVAPALPLLFVQAVLVEQALYNVLDNALRFSPEHGVILVKASQSEGRLCIDILDQGPGIPEADREKVFDMFFTVRQRDTREGSGLGLAICSGVIQAHGGEVLALGNPGGQGACIRLLLPLANRKASHEQN